MEYVSESSTDVKTEFVNWIIKTYIHSRTYNVLYLATKTIPLYLIFSGFHTTTLLIVLNLSIFFYFDIYIFARYFVIRHKFRLYYGDELKVTNYMKKDTMETKTKNSHHVIYWKDISLVKEKSWYFFVYKGDKIYTTIFKWFMTKEEYDTLVKYFKEQKALGRNVILRQK